MPTATLTTAVLWDAQQAAQQTAWGRDRRRNAAASTARRGTSGRRPGTEAPKRARTRPAVSPQRAGKDPCGDSGTGTRATGQTGRVEGSRGRLRVSDAPAVYAEGEPVDAHLAAELAVCALPALVLQAGFGWRGSRA